MKNLIPDLPNFMTYRPNKVLKRKMSLRLGKKSVYFSQGYQNKKNILDKAKTNFPQKRHIFGCTPPSSPSLRLLGDSKFVRTFSYKMQKFMLEIVLKIFIYQYFIFILVSLFFMNVNMRVMGNILELIEYQIRPFLSVWMIWSPLLN